MRRDRTDFLTRTANGIGVWRDPTTGESLRCSEEARVALLDIEHRQELPGICCGSMDFLPSGRRLSGRDANSRHPEVYRCDDICGSGSRCVDRDRGRRRRFIASSPPDGRGRSVRPGQKEHLAASRSRPRVNATQPAQRHFSHRPDLPRVPEGEVEHSQDRLTSVHRDNSRPVHGCDPVLNGLEDGLNQSNGDMTGDNHQPGEETVRMAKLFGQEQAGIDKT